MGCNSNRLQSGDAGLLIYWSVTQRRYPGLLMCFCFPSPSLKWSLQGLDFCSLVCFLCPHNWKGLKDSAQCSFPVQSNQVKRCLALKMWLWDVFLFFLRDWGLYRRHFVPKLDRLWPGPERNFILQQDFMEGRGEGEAQKTSPAKTPCHNMVHIFLLCAKCTMNCLAFHLKGELWFHLLCYGEAEMLH